MNALSRFLALVALSTGATAQLTAEGVPVTSWAELDREIPTQLVPTPDVPQLMLEDEARQHRPLRYGEVIETKIDVNDKGRWDEAPDGSMVWRMRITSPGAYSLGIVFDKYNLVPGEQVFFYNDDKSVVYGAYTDQNNQPNLQLGVEPFPGDTMVIEYVRQSFVSAPAGLSVGSVTHDYRNVMSPSQFVGGSCLIGINCPQGSNYQDEKRAVFRTLVNGSLCSAALINNTAQDGTQYFLTAEHCGGMSNAVFRFGYEASGCSTNGGNTNLNISGATFLASNVNLDSQLYRINSQIPATWNPYWLGWNRSNSNQGGECVTIGHGGGGPKNMAIDASGAVTSGFNDWLVDWTDGYIIGGNSGGPLLDSSGRALGPACCVNEFVCGIQVAWYGRFGRFWSQENLGQWLDPAGTNQSALAGWEPGGGGGPGCSGPLSISSVTPFNVEALIPGTDKTIEIQGCGFAANAQVTVDGVPVTGIPSPVEVVDSATIRFDMPQLDSLGLKQVEVTVNGSTAIAIINVVAPSEPRLQVGNGDDGNVNLSFAGLDVTYGGLPGSVHYVIYSTTSIPSVAPGIVTLLLGNNFTNIPNAGIFVVPAKGWDTLNAPVASPGVLLTLWSQSVDLGTSAPIQFPLDASNLQRFLLL